MSSVTTEFVKQPIVTVPEKLVEGGKIWMTVATAFAVAEEIVDTMSVVMKPLHAVQTYSSFATTTDRNTVWRQTSLRP